MGYADLAAECERLARDFGRLALADVSGAIVTERQLTWSRLPIVRIKDYERLGARILAKPRDGVIYGWADGCKLSDVVPQTVEEELSAPVWYGPLKSEPIVNSVGHSMVMESGWSTLHEWEIGGTNASHAYELLERTGEWTLRRWGWLSPATWPGRGSVAGGHCWPDVVNQVSELARDATLPRPEWSVIVGKYRAWWPVSMWKLRDEYSIGGEPQYTAEDVERIGEDPEVVLAARKHWLRDTENALEWLANKLRKQEQPVAPVVVAVDPVAVAPQYSLDRTNRTLEWFGERFETIERNPFEVIVVLYDAFVKGSQWVTLDKLRSSCRDVRALERGMAEVFTIRVKQPQRKQKRGDKKQVSLPNGTTAIKGTGRIGTKHPIYKFIEKRGGAGAASYRLRPRDENRV